MVVSLGLSSLVLLALVIAVAGAVNGIAGFGFAVVATMVLASVMDPATAVVFMILPILAVNITLAGELSAEQVRTCGRRFGPLILPAIVGTAIGMVVLDVLPERPLRLGLGAVTLLFVGGVQRVVTVPGLARTKKRCFVQTPLAMGALGGVGGALFGGTSVGVQLVAYLRSCDLDHGLFVGVVALVFLGMNAVRVGVAGALGLYSEAAMVALSLAAVVPALAGIAVGTRLRRRLTPRLQRGIVLWLLLVVGLRLVLGAGGIV